MISETFSELGFFQDRERDIALHDRVHDGLDCDFCLHPALLQRLPVLLQENFCILDLRAMRPIPAGRAGGIDHVEEDDFPYAGDILYVPEDSL